MAYIGKQPIVGNFVKLDAITATATTTFNLLNGGVAYYPQSPNHCLVSLNGILQAPTDSFTISGSTIIFSSALTTSDVIDFIIVLGDVLNIGTPSDNTVSLAKLTATGTKDATTFLRGDNTFSKAGKVLQVITATDDTQRSTTSTSFVTGSNTLSVSITPSSASNKVFITVSGAHLGGTEASYTIYRDSTNLGSANGLSYMNNGATTGAMGFAMSVLDSPSSTSAIIYQLYMKAISGTAYINNSSVRATITAFEIAG
jgi:hypothetical protein